MNGIPIKTSDPLEGAKVLYPEMLFDKRDFAPTDASFDTDRWISASTLMLGLVPFGVWCWWSVISTIISLF